MEKNNIFDLEIDELVLTGPHSIRLFIPPRDDKKCMNFLQNADTGFETVISSYKHDILNRWSYSSYRELSLSLRRAIQLNVWNSKLIKRVFII